MWLDLLQVKLIWSQHIYRGLLYKSVKFVWSRKGFPIKCVCLGALFAIFAVCLLDGYIGHFRVPLNLHSKSKLSAKSLL